MSYCCLCPLILSLKTWRRGAILHPVIIYFLLMWHQIFFCIVHQMQMQSWFYIGLGNAPNICQGQSTSSGQQGDVLLHACRLIAAATCPGMVEWRCACLRRSTAAKGKLYWYPAGRYCHNDEISRQLALRLAFHVLRVACQKRHVYFALQSTVASSSGLRGVQWHGKRGLHVPVD